MQAMLKLFLITLLFATAASPAFAKKEVKRSLAGEPKAALFRSLAESTVKTMYGRRGDHISVQLKQMEHGGDPITESWEVSLSNGANVGSALYRVDISQQQGGSGENREVASIKVTYLSGT